MRANNTNVEERILSDKWREKAVENGKPKKRHVYGQFRKEELIQKECSVFVADETFVKLGGVLSEYLSGKEQIKTAKMVSSEKRIRKSIKRMKLPTGNAEEALAKCGTVIALGGLPVYFAKRDGQKVVVICPENDGNTPREKHALVRAASLLNASEILRYKGNDEELSKAVVDALHSDSLAVQGESKKRILIISDNTISDGIEGLREIINIASFMSGDDCELTFLLPNNTENTIEIKALRELPETVNFVIKKGPLACSVDDYIHTHLIIDRALPPDEIVRDAFRTEAIRLLGRCDFDSVICFGEMSTYIYYLVESIVASKKAVIEPTISEEQTSNSILERIEEESRKEWLTYLDVQKLKYPYCCSNTTLEDVELKEIVNDGFRYCALENADSPGQLTLQLLLCPEDGEESLISYGDSGSVKEIIESFAGEMYAGKNIYFYGGDPSMIHTIADDFGISDRVKVFEMVDVQSYGSLGSYLKRFGAYLTADVEEYNEVGDIMHRLGKETILSDTGMPVDIPWEKNLEKCRERLVKELL